MGTAQVRVMNLNTPVSEACASASASGSGPLTPESGPQIPGPARATGERPRRKEGRARRGDTQSRWQAQALTATLPRSAGGTRLGATGRSVRVGARPCDVGGGIGGGEDYDPDERRTEENPVDSPNNVRLSNCRNSMMEIKTDAPKNIFNMLTKSDDPGTKLKEMIKRSPRIYTIAH